jgi:hypothetical protein
VNEPAGAYGPFVEIIILDQKLCSLIDNRAGANGGDSPRSPFYAMCLQKGCRTCWQQNSGEKMSDMARLAWEPAVMFASEIA